MSPSSEIVDVLVIGAGQAGLAAGYYLKQTDLSFAIIGMEKRIGDPWRMRYDSLLLFTPRWNSALPGMALAGDPDGYPTKDEIADYLERYARHYALPVHLNIAVQGLWQTGELYNVSSSQGNFLAKQLVVATGPFQQPSIPSFASGLPKEVYQLHTSQYKNPQQLKEGSVLIVGAGNSGAQIAVELAETRETYLSAGQPLKFFPLEILEKSLFWWLKKAGISKLSIQTKLGQLIMRKGDPIMGKALKKEIKKKKVSLKPRTSGARSGLISFQDGSSLKADNIIWATGFYSDYSWMAIPAALNEKGKPVHHRGVSPVKGLYFLGLPWQHKRASALIGGVGEDAAYLLQHIMAETGVKKEVAV